MSKSSAGHTRLNCMACQRYQTFVPAPLTNQAAQFQLKDAIINRLAQARSKMGYLEGLLANHPERQTYIDLLLKEEVYFSARIEGNRANFEDLFNASLVPLTVEAAELQAHEQATRLAWHSLMDSEGLPLCLRLLTETHASLLNHARGYAKAPGAFRSRQNWIGASGATIQEASHVPPNPADMMVALQDLERYMHQDDRLDPLIRAALIHYQFETIHPFLDGNGRIGRLLVLLFLMQEKVISAPYLMLSRFFERHRLAYYEHLNAVRQKGSYDTWVAFFLDAVVMAVDEALDVIKKLETVDQHLQEMVLTSVLSKYQKDRCQTVWASIKAHPMLDVKTLAHALQWTFPTTSKFVRLLVELGILREITGAQRGRIYVAHAYLEVMKPNVQNAQTY